MVPAGIKPLTFRFRVLWLYNLAMAHRLRAIVFSISTFKPFSVSDCQDESKNCWSRPAAKMLPPSPSRSQWRRSCPAFRTQSWSATRRSSWRCSSPSRSPSTKTPKCRPTNWPERVSTGAGTFKSSNTFAYRQQTWTWNKIMCEGGREGVKKYFWDEWGKFFKINVLFRFAKILRGPKMFIKNAIWHHFKLNKNIFSWTTIPVTGTLGR